MKVNKKISLFLTVLVLAVSCACIARSPDKGPTVFVKRTNPSLPQSKCRTRPVVIAVIDTGFGWYERGHSAHLCKFGHKDFTTDQRYSATFGTEDLIPQDLHGHGTNIVGVIDREASKGTADYCIVVLKYYKESNDGIVNLSNSTAAINYARQIHADYINYSGGGVAEGQEETLAVKAFLDGGGKFIAAAGNERMKLDNKVLRYFPAMSDSRTIVVGNMAANGMVSKSSNYGDPVNRWEVGENISAYDITFTGTSQATAVATGKIVAETERKCH